MLAGRITPAVWERWYWRKPDHREALRLVTETPCDLLHIDEAIALPIGIKAAETLGCKVLFDAHEYSPGQDTDKLWWRVLAQPFYTHLIRHYAPRADVMTTVALGIAERYRREFGLDPAVIMNAPYYTELPFHPVDPDHIRIIHHATAVRDRQLEQMIETVATDRCRASRWSSCCLKKTRPTSRSSNGRPERRTGTGSPSAHRWRRTRSRPRSTRMISGSTCSRR